MILSGLAIALVVLGVVCWRRRRREPVKGTPPTHESNYGPIAFGAELQSAREYDSAFGKLH